MLCQHNDRALFAYGNALGLRMLILGRIYTAGVSLGVTEPSAAAMHAYATLIPRDFFLSLVWCHPAPYLK